MDIKCRLESHIFLLSPCHGWFSSHFIFDNFDRILVVQLLASIEDEVCTFATIFSLAFDSHLTEWIYFF